MTPDPNPMPNITTPAVPTRKVGAGALAGAISVVLVWALNRAGAGITPEIAQAITIIMTFLVSYVVKEP